MEVGERSDAETVCGMELTLKELATSVSNITKLEKVCRR